MAFIQKNKTGLWSDTFRYWIFLNVWLLIFIKVNIIISGKTEVDQPKPVTKPVSKQTRSVKSPRATPTDPPEKSQISAQDFLPVTYYM